MDISKFQIAAKLTIVIVGVSTLLFASAGTIYWPAGWLYIVTQYSVIIFMTVWMWRNNRALLQARYTLWNKPSKSWDKVFIKAISTLSVPYLMLPGLDVMRFHWSHMPMALQVVGYLGLFAGLFLVSYVVRTNTFLFPVVHIAKDKGHHVISSGPYGYVRHPMYVGIITYLIGVPLLLGSVAMLAVALVLVSCFFCRTYLEDKTLHRELDGYPEYAERVRFRIIPGVW